ncbi:MBL fold metallo-hydrolase [Microbacterium sp. ASV49]|uniref:MBL fold metallo-hydrolase n=1 Tax=Microbacterium candidum TaxID=3041922 RepID=A0ABT7MVP4_9MICO|nr:MBL fold metallo-hydrolase [Microbacterium sp. ASV49]MDL9978495.1 MBL fold metallo-hydrolase [Microbacterium sp. ASV49]
MSTPSLRFLGATDTVTGSRYLIETATTRVAVDCGLYQGFRALRDRNRQPFPVDASSIDAAIVTHAHLDHTGYLPALVKQGFGGRIHATSGTTALAGLVLADSGRLQEEEAEHHARHGTSKHEVPQPLYTEEDAQDAIARFTKHEFDEAFTVGDVRVTFVPAGHILGASQLRIEVDGVRLHFTGDLGRPDDPLMRPPRGLEATDVLVTEATYGDRIHPHVDATAALGEIVRRVCGRGGVVVIPAFAIGRAETILLHLSRLHGAGQIPDVPIYLNSPMAVDASEIYAQHPEEHRLSRDDFAAMYRLAHLVHSVDESKALNARKGPMIIISASGMIEGGRVLHHVQAFGPDPKNAIVLTGYQSGGTRGARLQHGERTLRIFGEDVPINAEVDSLEMMSAHADADQIVDWMRRAPAAPRQTFVTHAEPEGADALRLLVAHDLGWRIRSPQLGETVPLTA